SMESVSVCHTLRRAHALGPRRSTTPIGASRAKNTCNRQGARGLLDARLCGCAVSTPESDMQLDRQARFHTEAYSSLPMIWSARTAFRLIAGAIFAAMAAGFVRRVASNTVA